MSRNIGDLERDKFWQPNSSSNQIAFHQSTRHYFSLAEESNNGFNYVNKFGRVINYSTTIVDVNDIATPAVYAWLTTAVSLEAISSSANDTAAGTGARTVVVQGLDANFEEIEETITMAGLSASTATTAKFIRVHRAYVATSGTYGTTTAGSHIGNITIRVESAGAVQIYLPASPAPVGQSNVARYTIPAGKTGYLIHATFQASGNKPSDFYLWRRNGSDTVSAPYTPKRLIEYYSGVSDSIPRSWDVPIKLTEKTDIWASAVGSGAGTNGIVTFDLILVGND